MRFLTLQQAEIQPFETEYRYSVFNTLLAFLVTAAISIGAAFFTYRAWGEGTIMGTLLAGWLALWFGLFAMFARSILRARLRPTNWLVRTQTSGILVKFRSYLNYHLDSNDPVAAYFDYSEIEYGRSHRVRQDFPGGVDDDTVKLTRFAEFKMRDETLVRELETQLAAERARQAPYQGRWIRCRTKSPHYPVFVSADRLVRIEWNVRPKVTRFLEEISRQVLVKEAAGTRQNLRELPSASREDQEKVLLELIATGDRIGAIKIIRSLYGYNLTRAVQFLDELSQTNRRA
ncbi:MAG TPA: hypothetical protein VE422_07645 [Terriglobia bacterium]|nr:hypothetical protein [Terriglobia bacterium]